MSLTTADGFPITVLELSIPADLDLTPWAAAFRQNYCPDSDIDLLREGTGLTRAEYLEQLVFPDKTEKPGPAVRSGDFAELLISDYVESVLGYWVPRDKYAAKATRDESVKGVDIIGFKVSGTLPAPTDEMLAFEAKGQLTNTKYDDRLQTAIDDSSKDYFRRALTLNATKQRLYKAGEHARVALVARFQNEADRPYRFLSGAAAVLSDKAFNEDMLKATKVGSHRNASNLQLIVVRGTDLMKLAHAIYEVAANAA